MGSTSEGEVLQISSCQSFVWTDSNEDGLQYTVFELGSCSRMVQNTMSQSCVAYEPETQISTHCAKCKIMSAPIHAVVSCA